MRQPPYRQCLLFPIILILSIADALAADKQLSGYLKTEVGIETNILESKPASRNSILAPLLGSINYRLSTRRLTLSANSTGGLIAYDFRAENKASLGMIVRANYNFHRRFFINSTFNTFQKWWLRENYNYNNSEWHIGLGMNFKNITPVLNLILLKNIYPQINNLDNYQIGALAEIQYRLNPNLTLCSHTGYIAIEYPSRRIFAASSTQPDSLPLQNDRLTFFQIGIESRRRNLSGLRLKILNCTSNNEFSEYSGASLNYYLSGKIGRGYYQVIADILLKKYRSDLGQYYLYYNPDPEQNIQNQLLLGWEWPLWKHLALTGRMAVMRNETCYSGLYYNKWFFSGGLLYRFD